ncbi:potassium-transporting ATPase subunit F [Synechococcus elongatus]|uniref:Potassium-transporting ATPase subunit F n=1 Tax=Synechococcus elongatus PCC 11802 TaxID=2283154 RepID=A0AAT9JU75_SYNEL|nr:potassium-transporting ATPase subunit F [Synechococcus elongatus]QFZ92775.1 potassium-transporting ATPase subunit F [Synechococcus elongatus PCC 11802]
MTILLDPPATVWMAAIATAPTGLQVALLTGVIALSVYLFYVMLSPEKF